MAARELNGSEEQERKVKEFMRKKEQELQHSCQVEMKAEGILEFQLSGIGFALDRLYQILYIAVESRSGDTSRDTRVVGFGNLHVRFYSEENALILVSLLRIQRARVNL